VPDELRADSSSHTGARRNGEQGENSEDGFHLQRAQHE
jgi:hypothetical protein